MARDGLEGFRGIRPDGLRKALAANAEPTGESDKYQRLVLGVAAEKLMAGVADAHDVGRVMLAVVAQAEQDAKGAMQALLAMPDPTTPEARDAHFSARVAAQVLTYLNDMIRSGHSAGRELTQSEDDGS